MPVELTDKDRMRAAQGASVQKAADRERVAAARLADAIERLERVGNEANEFGLQISPEAIAAINELPTAEARADLAHWIAMPEHYDTITHPLMSLSSPEKQADKIREYAKREDWRGSATDGETDDYLSEQSPSMARRLGKRRAT